MSRISTVHVLVHPDYNARNDTHAHLGLHPIQKDLRASWEGQAITISKSPCELLVYISAFGIDKLRNDSTKVTDRDVILEDDLDRIRRFSDLLGDRLVILPNDFHAVVGLFNKAVKRNNLTFDTDSLQVRAFGEYYEGCVKTWGNLISKALGVSDERYSTERELSFQTGSMKTVNEWRLSRYKEM